MRNKLAHFIEVIIFIIIKMMVCKINMLSTEKKLIQI